jgi:hypothetical protein
MILLFLLLDIGKGFKLLAYGLQLSRMMFYLLMCNVDLKMHATLLFFSFLLNPTINGICLYLLNNFFGCCLLGDILCLCMLHLHCIL